MDALKPPVFIVGCGHSGTSLMLAILNAHPVFYAVPYESEMFFKSCREEMELKASFSRQAAWINASRWVEKTPKHIKHLYKILTFNQRSKVILMLRDGRDVAYSIKQRTGDLKAGAERWVSDNMAGESFWHHPRVLVVQYENLVTNFDAMLWHILRFLGEKYATQLKNFHTIQKRWYSQDLSKPANSAGANHNQYRNWQINQPLFDGRGRYKNLSKEELSAVVEIEREMLIKTGYIDA